VECRFDIKKFEKNYSIILPVLYIVHSNPFYKEFATDIKCYLYRAIFFNYFGAGNTNNKLSILKQAIDSNNGTITIKTLDSMEAFRITTSKLDEITNSQKSSITENILHYLNIENNIYNTMTDVTVYNNIGIEPTLRIQSIYPEKIFQDSSKRPSGMSHGKWFNWRAIQSRLPNLALLPDDSGYKNYMTTAEYTRDMTEQQRSQFMQKAFIPSDATLELRDFDEFYDARKKLLTNKISQLMKEGKLLDSSGI